MAYQYYVGGIAQALENPNKKSKVDCTSTKEGVSNASENQVEHCKKRKLKGNNVLESFHASENHSKKKKFKGKDVNLPKKKLKVDHFEKSKEEIQPPRKKKTKKRLKAKQSISLDKEIDSETINLNDADNRDDPEKDARTVFVGNLPLTVKKKDLKTLFSRYGRVESVRRRSVVPLKMGMSKKVAVIQKKFNTEKDSLHAYVVMDSVESAAKALINNGTLLEGHHIRVDLASKKEHDHKMSVFVGNLPFNCQDEELYNFFGQSFQVESVRVVRDSDTGICKGFGFVTFKSKDCVELALKIDSEFKGRHLRIMRSKKQQKKPNKNAPGTGRQKLERNNPSFEGVKSNKGINERKRMQRKIKFANLSNKSGYPDTRLLSKQKRNNGNNLSNKSGSPHQDVSSKHKGKFKFPNPSNNQKSRKPSGKSRPASTGKSNSMYTN